jgi:hypothetical protein
VISRIRPILAAFAFFALFSASISLYGQVQAAAPITVLPQYQQRYDIYGGFAYSHFNPGIGRGVQAINLKGWTADATAWFKQPIGLEFAVRGYYGTIIVPPNAYGVTTSPMSEHFFMVGPNFRLLRRENYTLGLHALIGASYGIFDSGFRAAGVQPSQVSIYNNKVAFGSAWGGWADYNLNPKWSVRGTADWQPTQYGYTRQNEFAGTVGVVYKLGSIK